MIKGVKITLNGTEYEVPPLSLGSLEILQERIAAFKGDVTKENIATVIDCLHAAIKRNYPQMTRPEVAEMVDISSFGEVMAAVMGASGLARGTPGEEGNAGAPSTGAQSTAG